MSALPTDDGARLVLTLSGPAAPRAFFLGAPNPRFVLDLPPAAWAARPAVAVGGLVRGVRHGAHADRQRIVLDLSAEARLAHSAMARTPAGVRMTFELTPLAAAAPREPPAAAFATAEAAPRQVFAAQRRRMIVIDPGHGGRDPGAINKMNGDREKDLTLSAARSLREALSARGFAVALTRDSDVFLPLPERIRIARDRKADLFISLHVDSDPKGLARGATIYTLSQRGGARAKALIDAQDWDLDLGETPRLARATDILVDLTQRETNSHSAQFADALINNLDGVAPLTGRSHRQAGFFVLLAPDVPAALLEMGYISQAEDERRLADPRARRAMMAAVASAVEDYFAAGKAYASVSTMRSSFVTAAPP